jgi:hypothetical protein
MTGPVRAAPGFSRGPAAAMPFALQPTPDLPHDRMSS